MDKINKAAATGVVFFSIVLAGFVGSRVDQTTIALLGGTFIGLLVAVPATLLIVLISQRRRDEQQHERMQRYATHMPPNPPQYWAMPPQPYDVRVLQPQQPQLQAPITAPEFMLPMSRRRFYMIGEGGEVREIEAPRDQGFDDNDMRF
jgi:hypothetical protein